MRVGKLKKMKEKRKLEIKLDKSKEIENEKEKEKEEKKEAEQEKEKENDTDFNIAIYNKDSEKINLYPHLKQNILFPENNCKDSIDKAYYCFTCKCSSCEKCSLKAHKGHKLILKNDYMNFDPITLEEAKIIKLIIKFKLNNN